MASPTPQTYKNHARFFPLFHFIALPILLVNLINSVITLTHSAVWANVLGTLVALALVLVALSARLFALTVQDRVIRVEERLRYQQVLPAELVARSGELTRDQFVALRFASDAQLPGLMRSVLEQGITKRSSIKQMVQDWRADHLRA